MSDSHMKHRRPKRSFTPIGLDIADTCIHAAQFTRDGDNYSLHHATQTPIEVSGDKEQDETAVSEAVRRVLCAGFVGTQVVSALPSSAVDTRPIVLPRGVSPEDEVAFSEALYLEARSCLLYDPKDAVLNYLTFSDEADSKSKQTELLLIACRKDDAMQHLSLMRSSGARSEHIDSSACAAVRFLGQSDKVFAVVELDRDRCVVSIGRGRQLQFSRLMKSGIDRFTRAVTRDLEIDARLAERLLREKGIDHTVRFETNLIEAEMFGELPGDILPAGMYESCSTELEIFADELERSFAYFSGFRTAMSIEYAVLIGTVMPKGLDAFLSDRLRMPVSVGAPPESDGSDPEVDASSVVAAGLALRGAIS